MSYSNHQKKQESVNREINMPVQSTNSNNFNRTNKFKETYNQALTKNQANSINRYPKNQFEQINQAIIDKPIINQHLQPSVQKTQITLNNVIIHQAKPQNQQNTIKPGNKTEKVNNVKQIQSSSQQSRSLRLNKNKNKNNIIETQAINNQIIQQQVEITTTTTVSKKNKNQFDIEQLKQKQKDREDLQTKTQSDNNRNNNNYNNSNGINVIPQQKEGLILNDDQQQKLVNNEKINNCQQTLRTNQISQKIILNQQQLEELKRIYKFKNEQNCDQKDDIKQNNEMEDNIKLNCPRLNNNQQQMIDQHEKQSIEENSIQNKNIHVTQEEMKIKQDIPINQGQQVDPKKNQKNDNSSKTTSAKSDEKQMDEFNKIKANLYFPQDKNINFYEKQQQLKNNIIMNAGSTAVCKIKIMSTPKNQYNDEKVQKRDTNQNQQNTKNEQNNLRNNIDAKPEEIKINGSQSRNTNSSLNKNIEKNGQKVEHNNAQPEQAQQHSSQQLTKKKSEICQSFRQATPTLSQLQQQQFLQNNQITFQNKIIEKIKSNIKTNTYANPEQFKFSSQRNQDSSLNQEIIQPNNQQCQPIIQEQIVEQNRGQKEQEQKNSTIPNSQKVVQQLSEKSTEIVQELKQSASKTDFSNQQQYQAQNQKIKFLSSNNEITNKNTLPNPEESNMKGSPQIDKKTSLNKEINLEIDQSNNQQIQPQQKAEQNQCQLEQAQKEVQIMDFQQNLHQQSQKKSEIVQIDMQNLPEHTQQQQKDSQQKLVSPTLEKTNTKAKPEEIKMNFSASRSKDSSFNTNINQEIIQPNNQQCQSIIQQTVEQSRGQKEQEQKNSTIPNSQKVVQQLSEKSTEIVQELKQGASISDLSNQQQQQPQNKKIKSLFNTDTNKNTLPKQEVNMKGTQQIDKESSQNNDSNREIDQRNNQQIDFEQKVEQNQDQLVEAQKEVLSDINSPQILQQIDSQQINEAPRQDINDMKFKNTEISIQYLDRCDCILLQSDDANLNFYLVLSKFTVYVGQFNIEAGQKEGQGLILQRYFDNNLNSSYFHYQGEFEKDQIVRSGKLYNQKSISVLQEGKWEQIRKNLNRYPQISINPAVKTKIKITEVVKNNCTNQKELNQKRTFCSQEKTGFHDQLLDLKDITILRSTAWLNSSIIDSYIEHLNYQDEIHYWTLSKEERKLYQRVYIIPSWLFSWFQFGKDKKNFELFKETFQQFKPIQHKIWEIYKKIGFVFNSSNVHWYFVQVDFEKKEILFKDSMRGAPLKYNSTKGILQNLLNNIDGKTHQFTLKVCQECKQQENTYDCGAYTCLNAKEFAEGKLSNIKTGTEMRKFLLEFMQYTF